MRVLRLGLGDDRAVDLHPAVSVVTGLDDRQRAALRRGFSAIGTGLSPRSAGLLEVHGLLLDATQDDLDLLELPATAASSVATPAEVPGAVPDPDADRLRTAERDLLLLATDRWRSHQEMAHAVAEPAPDEVRLADRARVLRARIARHHARDPEPVRVALDHVRDARRLGTVPDPTDLHAALSGVGLDTTDLGLHVEELVRMAEDWLDERRCEAEWVVGAQVELRGIEDDRSRHDAAGPASHDTTEVRRRAGRAAAAHAEAVVRADELRSELLVRHAPRPDADVLAEHLVDRLPSHRSSRLAGAVPLLLDAALVHLDERSVHGLLDRLAARAGPVQLVVVDDHPAAAVWAESAGILRAAVVGPVAGSEVPSPA